MQILSKLLDGERPLPSRRLSVTTCVEGDDTISRREARNLMLEIVTALAIAVEQDEWRALSIRIVMKLDIGRRIHNASIKQPFYAFFRQNHDHAKGHQHPPKHETNNAQYLTYYKFGRIGIGVIAPSDHFRPHYAKHHTYYA